MLSLKLPKLTRDTILCVFNTKLSITNHEILPSVSICLVSVCEFCTSRNLELTKITTLPDVQELGIPFPLSKRKGRDLKGEKMTEFLVSDYILSNKKKTFSSRRTILFYHKHQRSKSQVNTKNDDLTRG